MCVLKHSEIVSVVMQVVSDDIVLEQRVNISQVLRRAGYDCFRMCEHQSELSGGGLCCSLQCSYNNP